MHFGKPLAILLLVGALSGCGSVGDTPQAVTPPAATQSIKAALNDLAQTGQMSSSVATLESDINKLQATDAAKSEALKKDYQELMTLKDPARIKAKAQEMISKL